MTGSTDAPAKLWQKGYTLHPVIERYEAGDAALDNRLVEADVLGSIAHARMLGKIGLLEAGEVAALHRELARIAALARAGEFVVTPADEDVHSKIENHLVATVGEAGKKIHTARSRNDQVLVDLRLFTRVELTGIEGLVLDAIAALLDLAERGKDVPMPGYTHMQRAMLSSVGLWAGAYAEALLDDLRPLQTAYAVNDQSPLGSAASYGVPFAIDRQYVADQLGFARVQNNVLYAQHGRGKFEGLVVQALAQVLVDLSKLAQDIVLFTTSEYDFFRVAPELCTGSSIMPQKHNLGALELVRGRAQTLLGYQATILGIVAGLPSGYNMDNQETKKPFIAALDLAGETLQVCALFVRGLEPNEEKLRAACSPELFATDQAYALVRQGMPFRDAYRQIAATLDDLPPLDPVEQLRHRTHLGASGNLGLDAARARLDEARAALDRRRAHLEGVASRLLAVDVGGGA
jgi:argininosuccinate lyase